MTMKRGVQRAMKRATFALLLLLTALVGCPADDGSDAAPADAAAADDVATRDQALDLGAADPLAEAIRPLVSPYVDPAAPDDLSKCIGAVVGVVTSNERRVFGFGATKASGAQVPDGDTVFQIGSISKFFTGLALARPVEVGQHKLVDPVNDHLGPDLQAPAGITLGHLVSHHASLPAHPTNMVDRDGDGKPDPGHDPLSPAAGYSRQHLAQFLSGYTLPKQPGTSYLYSNAGIGLLAVALADALKVTDYHTLLEDLVTKDLGMTHTWGETIRLDKEPQWLARLAQGYATQGSKRVVGKPGQMGVLAGAGEITSTANEMLTLLRALLGQTQTPLDKAIQRAILPLGPGPLGDKIGYAVEIESGAAGTLYKKAGSTSSYTAYLLFDRARQLGVVVMVNVGGFKSVKEIAVKIHGELLKSSGAGGDAGSDL